MNFTFQSAVVCSVQEAETKATAGMYSLPGLSTSGMYSTVQFCGGVPQFTWTVNIRYVQHSAVLWWCPPVYLDCQHQVCSDVQHSAVLWWCPPVYLDCQHQVCTAQCSSVVVSPSLPGLSTSGMYSTVQFCGGVPQFTWTVNIRYVVMYSTVQFCGGVPQFTWTVNIRYVQHSAVLWWCPPVYLDCQHQVCSDVQHSAVLWWCPPVYLDCQHQVCTAQCSSVVVSPSLPGLSTSGM